MATTDEYRDYILEQFHLAPDISARKMMGEYVLYCRGKVLGGLYDNRLMVKPVPAARALMPGAPETPPYPGARPMLEVEQVEDPAFLCRLAEAMWPELPAPAPKRRKQP